MDKSGRDHAPGEEGSSTALADVHSKLDTKQSEQQLQRSIQNAQLRVKTLRSGRNCDRSRQEPGRGPLWSLLVRKFYP